MFVLNVPYSEKDQARALGARWDTTIKKWYVPEGMLATPFECWMADGGPGGAAQAAAQTEMRRAPTPAPPPAITPSKGRERVDAYTGKTVVGARYFELAHDCSPLEECEQCQAVLESSGWAAARRAAIAMGRA